MKLKCNPSRRRGSRSLRRKNWVMTEIWMKDVEGGSHRQARKRFKMSPNGSTVRVKLWGRDYGQKRLYAYEKGGKIIPYIEVHELDFE